MIPALEVEYERIWSIGVTWPKITTPKYGTVFLLSRQIPINKTWIDRTGLTLKKVGDLCTIGLLGHL
jgi:hypothetical protein